jgi:transcriptional/translational regulatory protein YebC/TACO1
VITNDDGSIEVVTGPYDFIAVKDALAKAGLQPEVAEVVMKPLNEVEITGEDAQRMHKLIDALESLDDVQEVYTSAVLEEAA